MDKKFKTFERTVATMYTFFLNVKNGMMLEKLKLDISNRIGN